ncbi:hypothetical protein BT96DRAFT_953108 [Gymnopus androsaceus JB14]|uniref:Uncharacterized protein n=1 Tax=Gymnopus androsaceus JB14 TaxID=1447944 RepID=A0A6A4IE40_9AGAR|nr:hypothetical protein BT96DRAFT_953108 [Gymnopus androsaceus JB14]
MTVRFANYRLTFFSTVLGLAAHFAAIFLPSLHAGFTIFALVVPSLTLFILLSTLQWSQPRIEAIVLFVLWAIWLAMGSWSTDIIGSIQCDALGGQRTATKNGSISGRSYCYEMKAMSWMLITQAQRFGRWNIWNEPVQELGWYGEFPGYYNRTTQPMVQFPYYQGYAPYGYVQPGAQQPGQSIVIQPSANGPTVTQIPV